MRKPWLEIRDPVHSFTRATDDERTVIDSPPVQRLRHIHQLALTSLIYPGATHRRFEHSLGVMELAGRVYDVVTDPGKRDSAPESTKSALLDQDRDHYRRKVLRMAALCHDIGHLPFSHAAERDLLPQGWDHERLTLALIRDPSMEELWKERLQSPIRGEDIAKVAVGPKHADLQLNVWQTLLSEIITGDAFGVDRMDYLLRDSLHAGVAYGHFDHFRLIDTLRILNSVGEDADSDQPVLGVEEGGLHSAEALLMARYFMYTQVYFHRVRRIFDIHLRDFMRKWLPTGTFPTDPAQHLLVTDAEVTAALRAAAVDTQHPGHEPARRIVARDPYKLLWERTPEDIKQNLNAGQVVAEAAMAKFGEDAIRRDYVLPKSASIDFPVLQRDGRIVAASALSDVLRNLPAAAFDFVFVRPDVATSARRWFRDHRLQILARAPSEED